MKWNLYEALTNDSNALSELTKISKAHWGYSTAQMKDWDEELNISEEYINNNFVSKLVFENKIIAYFSLLEMKDYHIMLDNLFVHPSFMKKGIGSLLLGEAINLSISQGYKVMLLESDPHAENFYTHHGFQVVGKKETSIQGRFLPIMALKLNS